MSFWCKYDVVTATCARLVYFLTKPLQKHDNADMSENWVLLLPLHLTYVRHKAISLKFVPVVQKSYFTIIPEQCLLAYVNNQLPVV